MADGEDADIGRDVLRPVKEEDHPGEEKQMVIARHHVLGAEVDEGDGTEARHLLHIARVAFGDVVGKGRACKQQGGEQRGEGDQRLPWHRGAPVRPKKLNHVMFPDVRDRTALDAGRRLRSTSVGAAVAGHHGWCWTPQGSPGAASARVAGELPPRAVRAARRRHGRGRLNRDDPHQRCHVHGHAQRDKRGGRPLPPSPPDHA